MKKFMVLYMANAADFERMMQESTPEQQKKGMEGWMKWMGDNQAVPRRWRRAFGEKQAGSTPKAFPTRKNGIGGYSIVQADNAEAATKLFGKDHPHLQIPGGWIEVIEIMHVPGM